jgi:hypothetical protein
VKILHLTSSAVHGAAEQQFERLLGALQGKDVMQFVLLGNQSARGERIRALGVETRQIDFPGRFRFFDRRTINGEIKRFEPDIIMSWSPEMGELVQTGGPTHLGYAARDTDPALLASCDHLLVPSRVRADKLLGSGWSEGRVHVVPPLTGADAVAAGKQVATKTVDRKGLYTPTTTTMALTAADFDHDSGIDTLIKAIARLSGYYLWIAGDGPRRTVLEEYAHELGVKPRVRFLGWQNDLRPYLAVSDMFVAPGPQDDTGEFVLEAWEAGVPVIAADSLGPGLLIKQRENGVLVPVGDAINMAEAIKWLSRDPAVAKGLGKAGAAAFAESWPLGTVLPQYMALFEKLGQRPAMTAG